jgi:hypothetical protein
VIWSASPFAVIRSILGAEVTILDLTPGPEGTHRYVLMQFPWLDERVLVVSRTSLPFNVVPLHRGGSSLFHPATRSNPDLAAWVLQMIVGLGSGARRSFGQRMRGALWPGSDPPRVARQPNVDVFIGYRGADAAAAKRLHDELTAGVHHGGRPQRVRWFEPGQLARSGVVMPQLLRWTVLGTINDIISSSREMWIVDSPDYLGSWWTQGELLCRSFFDRQVRIPPAGHVRLRRLNPKKWRIGPGPKAYQPVINAAQAQRLSHLFFDDHPLWIPDLARILPARLPTGAEDEFAREFAAVPLLQCPRCSLGTPDRIDPDAFLHNRNPRLHPVHPDDLAAAMGHGRLPCPGQCGLSFVITPLPPAYLYYISPVGPNRTHLEPIPTYEARA